MSIGDTNRGRATTLLILLTLIWGTSFILMKKGLLVFSPGEVGSIRVASASLFLFPLALANLKGLTGIHYVKLFVCGLLGIFIPAFLFALAQTRMDSSVTGIMNSLTPICTLIIGIAFFHQKFRRQSLIGILIGLLGTVILIVTKSEGSLGGVNLYAIFVILACVCYATYLNFIKYKVTDLQALTITSVSLMLIGPLAMIYLFGFTGFTEKMSTRQGAWPALGFITLLGFMSTSVATILFNKLVKLSSPLFTSSVTYFIPVVAVFWGLFDGEKLFLGHVLGMAAIIGGVYLANRKIAG
jgi:drug/metabolite transporter (DMT)-like permease